MGTIVSDAAANAMPLDASVEEPGAFSANSTSMNPKAIPCNADMAKRRHGIMG